jgi:hypothetical protein
MQQAYVWTVNLWDESSMTYAWKPADKWCSHDESAAQILFQYAVLEFEQLLTNILKWHHDYILYQKTFLLYFTLLYFTLLYLFPFIIKSRQSKVK